MKDTQDMDNEKNNQKYNPEITNEDKKILGDRNANLRQDQGEDTQLKDRERPIDFAGKDLDIPGREFQNKHKSTKLTSEENKHFSLGSGHNEDLEQSDDTIE